MVVQGVCPAPKGMPLRNRGTNAMWQTFPINTAVPTRPAPPFTGSRNVDIQAFRNPRQERRLTNGRARSIAAYNRKWLPDLEASNMSREDSAASNLFSSTEWPTELSVPKVDRYRQTLTTLRANSRTDVPVLSRTAEWRRSSYQRAPRTFVPDVRFGKEWSHINFDGTIKDLSLLGPPSARSRPVTMG